MTCCPRTGSAVDPAPWTSREVQDRARRREAAGREGAGEATLERRHGPGRELERHCPVGLIRRPAVGRGEDEWASVERHRRWRRQRVVRLDRSRDCSHPELMPLISFLRGQVMTARGEVREPLRILRTQRHGHRCRRPNCQLTITRSPWVGGGMSLQARVVTIVDVDHGAIAVTSRAARCCLHRDMSGSAPSL
jgi:hypothetical protein